MFALILFFIGVFLLFKGSFRVAGRSLVQRQSRTIALTLMAPLILEFCMSSLLVYNNMQVNNDGTFAFTANALDYIGGTLQTADLILVAAAIGLVVFMVYGAGRTGSSGSVPATAQPQSTPSAARPPDIMTVAEAAVYMRVTEKEVLGLIDQGKLGAARIGDTYRIARIAIDDFMGVA